MATINTHALATFKTAVQNALDAALAVVITTDAAKLDDSDDKFALIRCNRIVWNACETLAGKSIPTQAKVEASDPYTKAKARLASRVKSTSAS